MKKQVMFLIVFCVCMLGGGVIVQRKVNDCYLCGNREDSLMSIYGNRESVGIVHLNTMSIMDTQVRCFDEHGEEVFDQNDNGMRITFLGEDYGSVFIERIPVNWGSKITLKVTQEDVANLERLKEKVCRSCLKQLSSFSIRQEKYGDEDWIGSTGYCVIDFQTRNLYPLSDLYSGIEFNDYVISIERKNSSADKDSREMEISVRYVPI